MSCPKDGDLVAIGGANGTVELCHTKTKNPAATLDVGARIYKLSYSRDGSLLAAACENRMIPLLDTTMLRGSYQQRVKYVAISVEFFPGCGDDVAVSYNGKPIEVWSAETGTPKAFPALHTMRRIIHLIFARCQVCLP